MKLTSLKAASILLLIVTLASADTTSDNLPKSGPAPDRASVVEYRLEAGHGQAPSQTFQWRDDSKSVNLETQPFMAIHDFRVAKIVSAGSNSPGSYNVELVHTKSGAKKFREVADRDRKRQFSILVNGRIVQSYAFPPEQKGVYDRGTTLYGPFTKAEAVSLARRINSAIRAQSRRQVKTSNGMGE